MMQFSWAMILIPVVLFVGISLAVRFVSLVMGMSRHDDRGSRLHAIGMTAAIGVGLFLAANVLLRPRLTGNSQRSTAVSVRSDGMVQTTVYASAGAVDSNQQPAVTTTPQPLQPPRSQRPPNATTFVNTEGVAAPPSISSDGNVMWLPLTDDMIAGILSPEGAAAIARLNESLAPELRQAYAMIPMSPPGSPTNSPVVRQALASSVVREALTPQNIRAAVAGMLTFLASHSGQQAAVPASHTNIMMAESEGPSASWIENPGVGQLVVECAFEEASVPPEEALRPVIIDALMHRVSEMTEQKWHGDVDWQKLVSIDLSDNAINDCVVETTAATQMLNTVDGNKLMRKTYALVQFPESVEQRVLSDVQTALKQNRAIALCVTLGILWLCSTLLSVMFRASQTGTIWSKMATVPILSLLVVPCILGVLFMVGAMHDGKTLNFTWATGRITCSIDDATQ